MCVYVNTGRESDRLGGGVAKVLLSELDLELLQTEDLLWWCVQFFVVLSLTQSPY